MTERQALFPLVKDQIDFGTLMQQVHGVISAYAGTSWSDTAAHDPGITLLEALCYGVSDLSYRTSLPLVDLLTPAPGEQRGGIFPDGFGPQQVLTVGPITADDYRRAILDLYSTDGSASTGGAGYFYFRDAQLVRESDSERYSYWHDPASHTYAFEKPDGAAGSTPEKLTLLGNYTLYLELTREGEDNKESAQNALTAFLRDNRNLCELVRNIVWMPAQDVYPLITVELDDDAQDAAPILAAIYELVEDFFSRKLRRYSAAELLSQGVPAETLYEGPQLLHGWIVDLPPPLDHTQPLVFDLSELVTPILAVDGVKSIQLLRTEGTDGWGLTFKRGEYPRAWGIDPIPRMLKNVLLFKHGQQYEATAAEVKAKLKARAVIDERPVTMPFGEWRNPMRYFPATDWIPPCYDLQDPAPTGQTAQLHRFLLPFEQQLADGCAQLALLPRLLSFNRITSTPMWDWQWPFALGSIPDRVHYAYKAGLTTVLRSREQDPSQEMRLLDYLLGYFGAKRAPRMLATSTGSFFATQRAYLSELGDLGYHRANVRFDRVSALQKRIAARLGIGEALFGESADMGKLPFYLVENRNLLPPVPETPPSQSFDVSEVKFNKIEGYLDFFTDVTHVRHGELIDLVLDSQGAVIRTLAVRAVGPGSFSVSMFESAVLAINGDRVLAAGKAGTLKWRSSNVWLTEMVYQLAYADSQTGLQSKQKRLTDAALSPFPVRLKVGDTITISRGFGPLLAEIPASADSVIVATVDSLDPVAGTYVVSSEGAFPPADAASKYRWHSDEVVADRFSFTISLVFDRTMLDSVAAPAMTEQWIRQVVLAEIPADVGVQFYWFSTDQFRSFAATYTRWMADESRVGDYAYQLLFQLALGVKPQVELGIALMKIASPEERLEVVGPGGNQWNTNAIQEHNLFYVPATSAQRSIEP